MFDDKRREHKSFQNRGGEIQQFRSAYKETDSTIFILNSFTGIGESALIERLKYLYDFSTIEKTLPRSAGFESLLLLFCDSTKRSPKWDTLDRGEIDSLASTFAKALSVQNKSILIIKSVGSIFDDYSKEKTIVFLKTIAEKLFNLKTHIKIILETNRKLPNELLDDENIIICRLRPLLPMYIGREIEQVANQITYTLSLPHISNDIISLCKGSPSIASLVGTYLGNKINKTGVADLSPDEISSFANNYVDGILKSLYVSDDEKQFLIEASVYRIGVDKKTLEMLPTYSNHIFDSLFDKMLFEETDEGYRLIDIIRTRLYSQLDGQTIHKIAAQYYEQSEHFNDNLSRAEYFYHLSFCNPTLRKKDIRYFSDHILTAAIEICEKGKDIDVALSHLLAIEDWKENNWRYQSYLSYCYILIDDYPAYQKAFELSIEANKNPESSYYMMIQKLIKARKLTEAETLLNIAEEKYGNNKQLQALWASYYYSNKNTRNNAIAKLILLSKDPRCDIYAAKIIVRLLIREDLLDEALDELQNVLAVWKNNGWAETMKYSIMQGEFDTNIEDDEDDENDGIENEI